MDVTVRPLTPELWPAFEGLFGERGAASRCWCAYWRVGPDYRNRPAEENRAALRGLVDQGRPPGLIALAGDLAVGWCQVTPRAEIPALNRMWRLRPTDGPAADGPAADDPADDARVWSISCLYVRQGYRRRGVTSALIAEAVEVARRAGAIAVEAYPFDARVSPSSTGTGYASTFEQAGFTTIARRVAARPVMRRHLKG